MKKIILFLGLIAVISNLNAQQPNQPISDGLKEALTKSVEKASSVVSQPGGFFSDAALKILLPPEAIKLENSLRKIGMGKKVDEAILLMNEAAEEACKTASPIFVKSIKEMQIKDALQILSGGDTAATHYLKTTSSDTLTKAFLPIVNQALAKTNTSKIWSDLVKSYNRFSFQKIDPDLSNYVTQKTLSGLFIKIGEEEKKIRKNPIETGSDLIKRIFQKSIK